MTTTKKDREAARDELLDTGKEKLRLAQLLLADWYEGIDCAESARRRHVGRTTVWRWRVLLGVQNRRIEPGSKSPGRLDSRGALEGVRP